MILTMKAECWSLDTGQWPVTGSLDRFLTSRRRQYYSPRNTTS